MDSRHWLSATLALTLLAACSEPPRDLLATSPRFQLVALEAAGGPHTPVAPTAASPEPVYGPGTLAVNLRGFLASARRVLVSMADVETVRVTLSFYDGPEVTKTVDQAALSQGQTTVTFTGLPVGSLSILVEALDANQRVIGSSRRTSSVDVDAPTHVDVAIPLAPLARASAGGSSGTGAPPASSPTPAPTEGLVPHVTIENGDSVDGVAPGTLLWSLSGWKSAGQLGLAPDGSFWTNTFDLTVGHHLVKVAPDGTRLAEVSVARATRLAVDRRGHVWSGGSDHPLRHHLPDGTAATAPSIISPHALAFDGADQLWVSHSNKVSKVSPTGQLLGTYTLPGNVGDLEVDPDTGMVWALIEVLFGNAQRELRLVELSPTGAVQGTRALVSGYSAVAWDRLARDAAGNMWVIVDGSKLLKIMPDGTTDGPFMVPGVPTALTCDPAGHVWLWGGGPVVKVGADGQVMGQFRVVLGVRDVEIDAAGRVWVASVDAATPLAELSP